MNANFFLYFSNIYQLIISVVFFVTVAFSAFLLKK